MTVGLLYTFEVCFVFICVFLVLLILIQKGRGGGLASAFGGAGGQTAFGSKTGDVLTWATSVVFLFFLVFAVALNLVANKINKTRYGSNTTSTMPLTPAERSSLPKEPPSEPADKSPQPGSTPSMPTGPATPTTMTPAPTSPPAAAPVAPATAAPASPMSTTPLPTTLP